MADSRGVNLLILALLPLICLPSVRAETRCRTEIVEGQVQAGAAFEQAIGGGLKVLLDPRESGWRLRIVSATGRPAELDDAELATPPYQSPNPLLISTDFGFRAQDALAWNPRHFRFAAGPEAHSQLAAAYAQLQQAKTRASGTGVAEGHLAELVDRMPSGLFEILDSRLTPGVANQSAAAAMVASHLNRTAHTTQLPGDGKATPLGRLVWMEFRIRLELPAGFSGVHVVSMPCM